ncbi:hypothetical protein PQR62_05400 [Herbaspirillum lusitanum]|uniref:Uncharacterized protein n=1 Tax=Herbaspirillum lusitanum TaxID=213312 RepID=A0ABW9A6W4_9BURK
MKKFSLPVSEKPSEHSLTTDAAIGDVIGRLWTELSPSGSEFAKDKPISLVVGKMGSAYNFNAQKVPPIGTGLIGGKDSKQRRALAENILKPMFGLDLYVRLMPPKQSSNSKNGDRTYWKGGEERLPILPPSKRGRPRKQTETTQ